MKPVIFVDIDDTLVRSSGTKTIPMTLSIERIKLLAEVATLYAWSSGGAAYARKTCEALQITPLFLDFLPKPNLAVDDLLKINSIHPNELQNFTNEEILQNLKEKK